MPPKLLLADDSITVQRVIALTFAGEGLEVVTVGDGDQAIERMPQIKALLQQGSHEPSDWNGCLQHLREIVA